MEIMKVFSSYDDYGYVDERLYSVLMTEEELALFSEKKEEKLKTGDKVGIWIQKHLNTKKDREAVIEALEEGKWHKYGKQAAKGGAVGGAIGGAIIGGIMKGGAKGAAVGSALGSAIGASGAYLGSRVGGALRNLKAKHSRSTSEENKRIADRARVASGLMSKEEYIKRHS